MKKHFVSKIAAVSAVLALTLSGCSQEASKDGEEGGDKGKITLGYIPSWTDGLSTAYLLENQLTKVGYDVEMETLSEAAILYAGVANGDVDMYPSAWPEVTHKKYMDEYGDKIEDLGAYYDNAKLTINVPTYTDIDSIEDLKGKADQFDGEIIGIEPGAGLTAQTKDTMMPEYGLDKDYELVTSSTATMLTELENKIDKKEDVVVTLWKPFWANSAYDVKELKDPKGAMGDAEALHFLGTKGFAEEFPEAAEYIKGIKLDDDQYGALEDLIVNEFGEGKEKEAVDQWLKDNPDAFDTEITD